MASPQVIWQLSKGFFQRNNPIEVMMRSTFESIHNLLTFQSKIKLLKYKFMLAQQQFNEMEGHVSNNPYELRGDKIDRAF